MAFLDAIEMFLVILQQLQFQRFGQLQVFQMLNFAWFYCKIQPSVEFIMLMGNTIAYLHNAILRALNYTGCFFFIWHFIETFSCHVAMWFALIDWQALTVQHMACFLCNALWSDGLFWWNIQVEHINICHAYDKINKNAYYVPLLLKNLKLLFIARANDQTTISFAAL